MAKENNMSTENIVLEQARQCVERNGNCPDTTCTGCFYFCYTGSTGTCNPDNAIKMAKEIIAKGDN